MELVVNIGDFAIAGGEAVLSTAGLGSCVALVLHDELSGIAGLAHILLPEAAAGVTSSHPAKFADTAVVLLASEMRRHGASGSLVAKLAGGARMFASLLSSGVNMGQRNIDATRAALDLLGIPVVAEDVGGEYGRSVRVNATTGRVEVRSLTGRDCAL
jgi:chemotaxis protein CheD